MTGEWDGFWEDEDEVPEVPTYPEIGKDATGEGIFWLALNVCITFDHPLRSVYPILNELPDVDAIAHFLMRVALGHYDLATAA